MSDEVQQSPPSEDRGLNRATNWKLKMCWASKQCFFTKKQLWGKKAYYGERWLTGPGEPHVEEYWVEKNQFLIWQLTK